MGNNVKIGDAGTEKLDLSGYEKALYLLLKKFGGYRRISGCERYIGNVDIQKKEWNIVRPTIGEIVWDENILDQPKERPIDIMAVTRGMCK